MFANMPDTAKEWAAHTKDIKKLPEKIKKKVKKLGACAAEHAVAKQVGHEMRLKINRPGFHGITKRKVK
jgi:Fe-S cluster assembly scaffold protein SufB